MYFEWDLINITGLLSEEDLAIFDALRARDPARLQEAVAQGGQINVAAAWGYTPLLVCAATGDWEMGEKCLELGADINKPMSRGITPLYVSVRRLNRRFSRNLVDRGANPNLMETRLENPAMNLVSRHDLEGLRILASGRIPLDFDIQYDEGKTLAVIAMQMQAWKVAEYAITQQKNLFLRDFSGLTLRDHINIAPAKVRKRLKAAYGQPTLDDLKLTAVIGRRGDDDAILLRAGGEADFQRDEYKAAG